MTPKQLLRPLALHHLTWIWAKLTITAVDNNYDLETLAKLLVTTSLDPKILEQATNIIRAAALLMLNKIQSKFTDKIITVVVDKIHTPTSSLLNQIKLENEFLSTSSTSQANQVQWVQDLASSLDTATQLLVNTTVNLDEKLTNLLTPFTVATDKISAAVESFQSITPPNNNINPYNTPANPSYANITANHTHIPPTQSLYNPYKLEHITHLESKLCIQERQVFITFDHAPPRTKAAQQPMHCVVGWTNGCALLIKRLTESWAPL